MLSSPLLPALGPYVDGAWIRKTALPTQPVHDPADGAVLAEVAGADDVQVAGALAAAADAFRPDPDLEARRGRLRRVDAALRAQADELARIITAENGKPLAEARGEVGYAAGFFAAAAERIDVLRPETLPQRPRGCRWTIHHRPAGVAALITPWNFPLAMMAKKLAAAVAAGCPAILKPSSRTPLTMIALVHLLDRDGGYRPGELALLTGDAERIVQACCAHPAVRIVSFTGSTSVGRRIASLCAPHVKRCSLELGGNAPFLVFADADPELAAAELVGNKFRAGGQTCVCANRVLVERRILPAFSRSVAARVERLRVGDGRADGVDVGPLIDRRAFDKVAALLRDALDRGARRIAGAAPEVPSGPHGCFFPPTVIVDVAPDMACWREEIFGPLVAIAAFDGEEEGLRLASDSAYGLAGYVFTADPARAARSAAALRCGHVAVNSGSGPTPEAPFGGMGLSGYGREGGAEGLREFTEAQTVAEALP